MAGLSVRGEWLGDSVQGAVRDAAAAGLLDAADSLLAKSLKMAPREHGDMADSAGTDVDPGTLIASVYYDDARDIKTIKQHEDLTYAHPRGGQAKFLEKPASRHQGALVSALNQAMRGVGW